MAYRRVRRSAKTALTKRGSRGESKFVTLGFAKEWHMIRQAGCEESGDGLPSSRKRGYEHKTTAALLDAYT